MKKYIRSIYSKIIFILTLIIVLSSIVPFFAYADDTETKTVRVGWHEPPYFVTDQYGRHSGYSYDYQIKVAAYTGWKYEYVEGTWSELLQKLKDGEIDMLSDVSYSQARSESMLFSSIPMGTETYYLFVSPKNTEIKSESFESLNGKRVGVTKGSIQKDFFNDWTKSHNINVELIEMSCPEEESISQLDSSIDAFVTVDVYGSPDIAVPVWKIGSSDFYFVISKQRPDLMSELDIALSRIQDENAYYDQQLHDKYLKNVDLKKYLSESEKNWLKNHGTVRIGYQDNYLAFCAKDPTTGELTGALKDYLRYASNAFINADLKIETVSYPSAGAAIEAMKAGEIDCMFPANLTTYDAENLDLITTPSMMKTEMDAVVLASEQKEFVKKDHVIVAVNQGNINYDMFLADHYPEWERKYFPDTPMGLEAIARKEVDCVIISNYRYCNISKQCEKLHLTTVYTGVDMDYCFAVCKENRELYSILSRITDIVPDAAVNRALTYYSTEDVKTDVIDIIKENLLIVSSSIALVLLIIIGLLLRSFYAEKKVQEEENLLKILNKRVFVDSLTSVRNKGAYSEYIDKIQNRLDQGESVEFAVGIFDCNNLKIVNDKYGHDKGDIYLKSACRLICKTFEHSPVFRIGGDEFAVILMNEDFDNRDSLSEYFEKKQKEITDSVNDKWEEIHIAAGIAVYDPEKDTSVSDTARRADRIMYENKDLLKKSEH